MFNINSIEYLETFSMIMPEIQKKEMIELLLNGTTEILLEKYLDA